MPPCGHIRMQDADGWVTLGCLYHFLYYKFDLKSYQARLFFRLCLELHLRSPIKKKKRNCNTCKEWEPVIFVHYKVAGNRPKCDFSFSSIQFNLYSVNFKYLYKYHSILLALWMWFPWKWPQLPLSDGHKLFHILAEHHDHFRIL